MDNSKRIAVIRESITKVARILTSNKVNVTQAGVTAFVHYDEATMKPTRVNLPMIPDDASSELIDAVQGFLDSEISKVLYADSRSALRSKYENLEGIYKPIESFFCEKEMVKAFPGARNNLNNMHQAFVDRFIEPKLKEALANGADEKTLFQVLAIPALRAWGGQPFFKDYMQDKWSLIAGIQSELDPIASGMSSMTKPEDCYELAKKIRNTVMGEPEESDGNNPFGDKSNNPGGGGKGGGGGRGKGKGTPSGSGDAGGGKGSETDEDDEEASGGGGGAEPGEEDEEGEEDGGEDGGDDGDDEADGDDGKEREKQETVDGADGETEQSDRPDLEEDVDVQQQEYGGASYMKDFDWNKVQDMSTEFGQFVTDLCSKEMENEAYTVFTREWDQIEVPNIPKHFDLKWMTNMEKAIDNMAGPVARQLERAFTAQNKSLWQQGTARGKMSPNNLYRLTAGDEHIFKKKIDHRTREVAVSLVVDCSGSMHGSKIFTAMCSAWVMSEVLQRLGVANEVIGFTTGDISGAESRRMYDEYCRDTRDWDRHEPIRMPIFKSFDERFGIEQKKRMASYPYISGAMACNIDGESVQYAYERLCKHANKGKPKGKMMIVFSDGQPSAGVHAGKLNHHLKHTVQKIEKEGTNIVGIGIMSNSVRQFYRKNVSLDNIEDLPGVMLKQLRDALLNA